MSPDDPGLLVRGAAGGDEVAWHGLVERFSGLVWAITRAHRLANADAADVSQTTWLRLAEHIGRIENADRVGAWLATATRRECLQSLPRPRTVAHRGHGPARQHRRDGNPTEAEVLAAETEREDAAPGRGDLAGGRAAAGRCRELIRILMARRRPATPRSRPRSDCRSAASGPPGRAACSGSARRLGGIKDGLSPSS